MDVGMINRSKSSKRSVVLFSLCASGTLLFVLLAIVPNMFSMNGLDQEAIEIEASIEKQKILFPKYQKYAGIIVNRKKYYLPFPKETALKQEDVADISKLLGEFASKHQLNLIKVLPDYQSIPHGDGSIAVTIVMEGSLYSLRRLLIEFGDASYVDHIEMIKVQVVRDGKRFSLKFWIRLEQGDSAEGTV